MIQQIKSNRSTYIARSSTENNPNIEVGLSIMENATKIDENLNSTAAAIKSSTNPATVTGLSVEVRLSILETQNGNINTPAIATATGAGGSRSLSMGRLDKELVITFVYHVVSGELVNDGDEYEYLRKQDRRWCRGKYSCFLIYGARIRHVLQRMEEEEEGKIGPSPHNIV
ncbi:hypothetical protein OROMI_000802 [Orobanche minor]